MSRASSTDGDVYRTRQEQVKRALFRGDSLHLENPRLSPGRATLLDELLLRDIGPRRSDGCGAGARRRARDARRSGQGSRHRRGHRGVLLAAEPRRNRRQGAQEGWRADRARRHAARNRGRTRRSAGLREGGLESFAAHERHRHDDARSCRSGCSGATRDVTWWHAEDALGAARQARGASGRRRDAPAGPVGRDSGEEQSSGAAGESRGRGGANRRAARLAGSRVGGFHRGGSAQQGEAAWRPPRRFASCRRSEDPAALPVLAAARQHGAGEDQRHFADAAGAKTCWSTC